MPTTIWKIRVRRKKGKLQIPESSLLPLEKGTAVVWIFDFDLPDSTIPALILTEKSGRRATEPFGPFTHLDFQPPTLGPSFTEFDHRFRIYASGFSGDTRTISYQACLLDPSNLEKVLRSNFGTLKFPTLGQLPLASHQVTVSLQLNPTRDEEDLVASLRVVPERIYITPGASVIWTYSMPLNLFPQQTWYPEILFPGTNFGPFQSISALTGPVGADPAHRSAQLIGAGDNGLRGSFDYLCRVRSSNGVFVVASGDPGVDDDGELQTPPPGGP